jgi:methyl-accepting chemotaxis protein
VSLNNISISKRLFVVLSIVLGLSLSSSLLAVYKMRQLTDDINVVVTQNIRTERAVSDWLRFTTAAVARTTAIAKSPDTGLIAYFAAASADGVRNASEQQKLIEPEMKTPAEHALFDRIGELRKNFASVREELSVLKKNGDAPAAERVFASRFEPTASDYLASVQAMSDSQRKQVDAAAQRSRDLRDGTTVLVLACCALSLAAGAALSFYLARSITRPIGQAVTMADSIARMDLTDAALTHYSKDESGRLLRSIDTMRTSLTGSLREVRSVVDSISTASHQIASGNQDLSARTEQTASNLQQTASSMEELTGTVRQSASSAVLASELATSATAVARRGGEAMSMVVNTMHEIDTSSKRIADIISVIDGIAFQTNILALNAAVEAARAGEQGRGFAVVASEVRSLAQRSADAAKEIKSLIGVSVSSVETGTKLVRDAGTTMSEIVASVQRVTDIVGEISTSASEQSDGIGQVNTAVNQLDQMTQQNSALVEESAAAADSLKDQASRLSSVLASFRMTEMAAA